MRTIQPLLFPGTTRYLLFVLALLAGMPRLQAQFIPLKDTLYPVPAGAYFVAHDGLATNVGTSVDSPWSLDKALADAPQGATVVLRGGEYRKSSTDSYVLKKRLTLQPYLAEKVWIKGSVLLRDADWVEDTNQQGKVWKKLNWGYRIKALVCGTCVDPNFPMAAYADMVFINDQSLQQVDSLHEVRTGRFYIDFEAKVLYVGSNPVGSKVESATTRQGIFLGRTGTGSDATSADGSVIRGLGFTHFGHESITIRAKSVVVEHNTVSWNGVRGICMPSSNSSPGSGTPTDGVDAVDCIVRGNRVSYNGSMGVFGNKTHRLLVEGNTLDFNNVERFYGGTDAAASKVIRAYNVKYLNNKIENNFIHGIWIDGSCLETQIIGNTLKNNHNAIWIEVSHKALVARNIVYGNGIGIFVSESSSVDIYHNTLANNRRNVRINEPVAGTTTPSRENTNAAELALGITWATKDVVLKNNIYSNSTDANQYFFDSNNFLTLEPSNSIIKSNDYNGWYRTSATATPKLVIWTFGPGDFRGYSGTGAFDKYRLESGRETHSFFIDNVAVNPFFVNEAAGDYHLKPSSRATRAGQPLSQEEATALGLPTAAGKLIDMGHIFSSQGFGDTTSGAFRGYYKLTVKHSGQALDVDGGATFDGANVRQWRSNGSPAQQWLLEAGADGYYTLKAKCSDKLLDVKYSSTASGANVWQWTPNGTIAQRWRIVAVGNGYYQLISKASGKALDVSNFSTVEGADVIQSNADEGDNQKWKIEPVAVTGTPVTGTEVVVSWGGPALRLHPNPATDAVLVEYEALTNGPATIDLQRLDRFRRERLRTVVDARAGVNQARVSVGHLPAGLYVVRVSSGNRISFTKLIINR